MKKNKIIIGILFLLVIIVLGGVIYLKNLNNSKNKNDGIVSLGSCNFNIETVNTDDLRKKGLSNRDSICENCGMLFLFEKEDNYFFWMKDMRFPIDIIWLKDDKVVEISRDVSHQSKNVHSSKEKANKVLELNASSVNRCKIKIGDKLRD